MSGRDDRVCAGERRRQLHSEGGKRCNGNRLDEQGRVEQRGAAGIRGVFGLAITSRVDGSSVGITPRLWN